MNSAALAAWLQKGHNRALRISIATAWLYYLLGFAAVSVWFILSWIVCLFFFPESTLTLAVGISACLLVIIGLIWDARDSSRDDLSSPGIWLLRETVGIGPRLLVEAWRQGSAVRKWRPLDYDTSAEILIWMAQRTWPVSAAELTLAFPDLRWSDVEANLSAIPGVLFLANDRSQVTLLPPLRLQVRQIAGIHVPPHARMRRPRQPEPEPEPQPRARVKPEQIPPHDVLGIHPDATAAEIKAAYRTRVKECHPDRFAGMDKASQEMAEEWTKALNAAYAEMLRNKRAAAR